MNESTIMKQVQSYFFATIFIVLSGNIAIAQKIQISGSDTMMPMVQSMASLYMEKHGAWQVEVSDGGSGAGIKAMQRGEVEIAMASRQMTAQEKAVVSGLREAIVAYDAVSIITHISNKVNRLTMKQLASVLKGEVTNWKELGGEDRAITIYTRDASSGTYGYMVKRVLGGKGFPFTAKVRPSNEAIAESLMRDRGGIGYVGLAYLDEAVQTVSISQGKGVYRAPTYRNALERKYPLLRPLYYYYTKDAQGVMPFIAFTLSALGQRLTASEGYVPAIAAQ